MSPRYEQIEEILDSCRPYLECVTIQDSQGPHHHAACSFLMLLYFEFTRIVGELSTNETSARWLSIFRTTVRRAIEVNLCRTVNTHFRGIIFSQHCWEDSFLHLLIRQMSILAAVDKDVLFPGVPVKITVENQIDLVEESKDTAFIIHRKTTVSNLLIISRVCHIEGYASFRMVL